MTVTDLNALASRLERLDEQPVATHPAVLDEVHRALVGELERLAGVVSGDGRGRAAGQAADDT